ncbi:disintegrin and metalloproteinase domain-containing protein 10-like [Lineus longissimus]|uniref:disintegrin and metalloproteinase domain-containing protein 10-like n=1 Tax=Lineus longissimus TaxID=88925 RepID=UPI00315CB4AE
MLIRELTALAFLCLWNFSHGGLRRLNDYVMHYEGLTYSTTDLHDAHSRVKRSISTDAHLNFNAHGQTFSLRLSPDTSIFSRDAVIDRGHGKVEKLDTSHLYQGELAGQPGSSVVGAIIDGTFRGYVKTLDETYYIEPSSYYFKSPQKFHSIIYADRRVKERVKRGEPHQPHCGQANPITKEWMESVQNSGVEQPDRPKRGTNSFSGRDNLYHNLYSESLNRQKRAPASNAKVCTLFMQSDPMLWIELRTEGKDAISIQREISGIFLTHVAGLKNIYEATTFKNSDSPGISYSGITFQVNKVQIQNDSACSQVNTNQFCNPYIDVSNFLNLNSLANHDDFCLAYMFTYRDFSQGTLGLAWVGAKGRVSGGICEQYKEYNEGGKRTFKSLNTGIVTFENYQQRVPTKVSILTFAHEVGHNFGSPHDYPAECMPYTKLKNDAGNFIMFAQATSGDRTNNNQFSPCSLNNISLVLDEIFNQNNGKINCFKDIGVAFCGNMLVEEGEECDCGYADQCQDKCCNPRPVDAGADASEACKLKPGYKCSSADPCCKNCQFDDATRMCSPETECSNETNCNGVAKTCPKPAAKEDYTPCNSMTQVCRAGDCKDSICQRFGWEECSSTLEQADSTELCYISCKANGSATAPCISSASLTLAADAPKFKEMIDSINGGLAIRKPAGSHCDNMQGYCDAFFKCRRVDADGPLARLKNLLFNPATLNTIKEWIVVHWWAVLLMAIGLILFMALFIKICSVHTPSSNPSKKPARALTLPRRRPRGEQPQAAERRPQVPQGPPPPYGAPSAPPGGPPPGKGKKRRAKDLRYQADIELHPHQRV